MCVPRAKQMGFKTLRLPDEEEELETELITEVIFETNASLAPSIAPATKTEPSEPTAIPLP